MFYNVTTPAAVLALADWPDALYTPVDLAALSGRRRRGLLARVKKLARRIMPRARRPRVEEEALPAEVFAPAMPEGAFGDVPGWIWPVAIGGGALALGAVFLARR